jgi:hypothetical protein
MKCMPVVIWLLTTFAISLYLTISVKRPKSCLDNKMAIWFALVNLLIPALLSSIAFRGLGCFIDHRKQKVLFQRDEPRPSVLEQHREPESAETRAALGWWEAGTTWLWGMGP